MMRPYAFLFPLAALLGIAGVGHWLLYWHGSGLLANYSGQGHALVQIQGFLSCFAFGFLFTMIPRRTQTAPPTPVEVVLSGLFLTVAAAGALREHWLISEVGFLAAMGLLLRFLRSRSRERQPDAGAAGSFILVRFGLLSGIAGALLVAFSAATDRPSLLPAGRALIQEGLFLGLVMGMGRLLHPALMGSPGATCAGEGEARRSSRIAVSLLILSFALQAWLLQRGEALWSQRAGYGLRGAVTLWYFLSIVGIRRRPAAPGSHRQWIWLSFWMIPLGLLLAAGFPTHRVSLMHVTFVSGFGLLAFGIARHVMVAHGAAPERLHHKSWLVRVFGSLFLFAMLTRVSSDFLPEYYWVHIEGAAGSWIAALAIWTWSVASSWTKESSGRVISNLRPDAGSHPPTLNERE